MPSGGIILDIMLLYLFVINLKHLPLILVLASLVHKPIPHTLSNACLKSMKAQYGFVFYDLMILSKLCRINKL